MKKIDKIDGCHHCPFRRDFYEGFVICIYPETENPDITFEVRTQTIAEFCPLPEDNV